MPNKYWFKPKLYGYGASSTTWEGWIVTAAFIAVVIWRATTLENQNHTQLAIELGFLVLILIYVTKQKTEGEWKWRWGKRKH
ncbi:MAG: hypothetical protein O2779_02860 [Nanoarchaeota archaeon]|nr:hypothetical protein [Nanoarchaeota archaeon]